MPILAGVTAFGVFWLYLLNRSWRKDKESLKPENEIYPLGWRIAVQWVEAHGYEASAARIQGSQWQVHTARGWEAVQSVMARPKRTPIIRVMDGVVRK